MTMTSRTLWRFTAGTIAAALLTLATQGCVGYAVYPPQEGMRGFKNPNSDPLPTLMAESVKWVTVRYPASSQAEWSSGPAVMPGQEAKFVVNLPAGVNRQVYQSVVRNCGPGALAMEPGVESLPTYHVARIWVQGDDAKVDVIRPVAGVPGNAKESRQVTQGITLRLRGGLSAWRVTSHNVWTVGALPVPAINYVPAN